MIILEDLLKYHDEYDVMYMIFDDAKGKINFRDKIIYINPVFNEDGLTYVHELIHHHYKYFGVHPSEQQIENEAKYLYDQHPLLYEKLAKSKLNKENKNVANLLSDID